MINDGFSDKEIGIVHRWLHTQRDVLEHMIKNRDDTDEVIEEMMEDGELPDDKMEVFSKVADMGLRSVRSWLRVMLERTAK